ncbi:tetratricopeptide repeat protein [Salinisphaera sp.]|uniref:tetratricopeptide repeat protein n=1 Tax=Salinisphaera sp. TaxID=1914330 RepID=UPI002D79684B|nr:tetratricopeptide repeat protein [Salinisphaera sp.]HET7314677.1 tetratricopeptide repeat protein [Salinisphaera sp.]
MSRWAIARFLGVAFCALLIAGCATDGGINREDAAAANANIGADYLHKGQNGRAQQAFEEALGYDENNFTANWGMAVVNERLDQPAAARRYFEKALSIRSAPAVYNSYAAFLCEQGDTDAGVANFKRALETGSAGDRADSLANAGLCLYRAHRVDEAAEDFRQALAANPKQRTALTHLAAIEYHAQNYMSARAFIERADAVTKLDAEQLLLAARIELALNDRAAAAAYLERHNANQPTARRSLSQLESSRQ